MFVSRQFGALLRKGRVSFQHRGHFSQLVQLFEPLLLVLLFACASFLGESEVSLKTGIDRVVHLEDPFETKYAARLCRGAHFAVAPDDGLGSSFRRFLAQQTASGSAPELVAFKDADAVENYVRSEEYGQPSHPWLCGAVTFDSPDGSKYTIRLNGTIIGNRGAVCGGVDTRRVLTGRAIDSVATSQDWYLCSGFLSLQRLVDDFVMRRGGGWNPRLEVDVLPFPTPSFKQRKALSSLREFISLFVVAFFAYASGQATSSIVAEREAKLLEAMKLMGLQDSARYLAETCQVLPLFMWYGLQLSVGLGFGVFIRCDPMLLACFMSLVGLSFGSAALCFSALFESAKGASLATMVSMFGVSRMPLEQAFGLLLPPVALVRGLMQLIDLELAGPGLQWSNLWHGQNSSNSLGEMMTAQLLAVPCSLFLWRYLEQVVPRDYGSRAGRARTAAAVPSEVVTRRRAQGKIAEETLPVACNVELQNVRKEFLIGGRRPNRRVVAVKRLDLGLAEGEILALLGHNGAGKSTTVSMLTGVLPPTEGRVIIHGYDVAQHPEEARRFLGVCPQHDILFDFLSADDHLRLAASLRGVQGGGSAQDLLRAVGLLGHLLGAPAGQLSSGRRRALCVALAFVGDPRFILLDEPTSGMDPYVRRSMWELLKKYRPGRALCLSTHYMDEAEMLGDHVCILSRGTLQCYGSPEWLKARLGSGYALTLSATQATRTLQVAKTALDLLQRNALGSWSKDLRSQMVVTRCEGSEAVLRVPFAVGSSFPELLRVLESQKTLLGFSSLSVSATTLEELFLSLADGEEAGEPKSLSPKKTPLSGASSPEKVEMPGGLDEQAASQMAAAMADLERSKPSKAHQGAALLRKRCLTLRRNRRAMLCLCLLPMIFNILGIASIATSFELDSPPLEIFGTSQALNPELAKQQKPSVVVAFGASGGGAEALMNAGAQAALWEVQPLSVNSNSLRATSRRNLSESLIIDANVLGGKSDPNEPEMDMSKYKEMKQKGAPEFVIRKVMEKDGVPTAVSERFMSGAAPATGSSERSLTGRLKVGLQDQAMLSLDAGQREAKVQFMFGEAAMKVDVKRAEEQRQELAQCASGGPMQLQLAEEALRRLDEDTQKNWQAMQEGGAPSFAQRAFLEKAGVAEEDVEILAFFASPEQVPSERLEDLQRCAKWQAFAEALLETRHELKAARYGGIFVERLNVKSRSPRGRLAIFQNTSVFHSAPLFLGLATKALAEDASVSAVRVPEVTNWPLPLTHRQRTLAFSSQGWSFFSMSLLGVAFLPAGLAVDAASSLCCGAIRQQAIAGMPLATYILASFAADVVLVMVPALSQLVFVYFFQMAVFVDCLGILTLLLVLYVLASTAQVYAMLSRFKSPNSAQNSTLALNMLTGFFLALTVWVLGIPFLGETANRLARAFTLLGRLSPAFNLSNAVLTIPNTSMPGFSNVNGFPISDWQVTGEPLLGLAVNLLLYSMLALRRRSSLRFGVSHGGAMGHKDRGLSGSASREVAPEVQAERLAAEQALGSPPKGLVLGSCSVSYTSPGPATPVLEPLSVLAGSGILGVLGVSGSGKSSLLAALAGGLPCNGSMQGQALLDGQRLASLHQSFGAVGYCPQENELTPGLTVREQIELFGRLRGLAGDQLDAEVRWLCFTLDLEAFEESQSENLSGGNQRKLQCACALVGSPRLVCLDEPSAGLDPMARRCLGNSLRAKMKVLSAVIIATKSIDEADALCSKLMFLTKDGCLRTVGSSLEIRQRYGGGHELRATLRRPSMQEVYDQVRSDPSLLRGFIGSCCRSLGIDPSEELLEATATEATGQLADVMRRLKAAALELEELEEEAPETVELSEDSEEMKAELASRSQRIIEELKPMFPKIEVVEEVSLLRVFQLQDKKRSSDASVADVFRQVESRKERLKIADYSITQASLEHVFNQLARQDH